MKLNTSDVAEGFACGALMLASILVLIIVLDAVSMMMGEL
jgi:hypothetical protein